MRAPITVIAVLLVFASLTGCANRTEEPAASVGTWDALLAAFTAVDGVADVDIDVNEQRESAALAVELAPSIDGEHLAALAALLEEFPGEAAERGYEFTSTRIASGASQYGYLGGVTGQALVDQLGYWIGLLNAGAESVSVRGFDTPAAQTLLGDGTTASEPGPRYVLVELPEGITASELGSILGSLAAVPDPGAPHGQWDFVNLAPATKGEYVGGAFPTRDVLKLDASTGELFTEMPGLASIVIRRDPDATEPMYVDIVAFDDAMDGVARDNAEVEFMKSDEYTRLTDLVQLFEARPAPDYRVEVLSSTLGDGGNFHLWFDVNGCDFTFDSEWPVLAEHLGNVWTEHLAPARHGGASAAEACTVNGAPVGKP